MTTIAITATDIAGDGLRMFGDQICGTTFEKIKVVQGKAIYGYAGSGPLMDAVIAWHQAGADPESLPVHHMEKDEYPAWVLVVVDRDGCGRFSDKMPHRENFDPPFAIGAGTDVAVGAMLAGASAREAIEIVASRCYHTGGKIQSVNIAEALGLNYQLKVREAAE